jgi:hypothetical protein
VAVRVALFNFRSLCEAVSGLSLSSAIGSGAVLLSNSDLCSFLSTWNCVPDRSGDFLWRTTPLILMIQLNPICRHRPTISTLLKNNLFYFLHLLKASYSVILELLFRLVKRLLFVLIKVRPSLCS